MYGRLIIHTKQHKSLLWGHSTRPQPSFSSYGYDLPSATGYLGCVYPLGHFRDGQRAPKFKMGSRDPYTTPLIDVIFDPPARIWATAFRSLTAVSSRHLRSANQHQLTLYWLYCVPYCQLDAFCHHFNKALMYVCIWLCAVGELHSAVGLSLLLARWSGTHYRLSFAICLSVLMFFGALLRRYYSRDISASSAIEMYQWYCVI